MLPHPDDCRGALQAIEAIWDRVPRSERPKLREAFEGVRGVLQQVQQTATQAASSGETNRQVSEEGDKGSTEADGQANRQVSEDADEETLVEMVLPLLRELDAEEWMEVQLHMKMRDLAPERRLHFAGVFEDTFCLSCGEEDEEEHACGDAETPSSEGAESAESAGDGHEA